MKCYIYKIINLITNEKYVGQTTNYNRRKENHLSALHNNRHPNPNYFRKSKEIYNSLTDSEIYNRAELVYNKYNIQGQLTYKLADKKNIIRVNCAL